jgi:hypothetical protein
MTNLPAPSQKELARAFDSGCVVRAGGPTYVPLEGGGYAVRNLAAAVRGDPDPWYCVRAREFNDISVIELSSSCDRTLAVAGRAATGSDVLLIEAALGAGPREDQRHTAEGDAARLRAGEIALEIRDAHMRAHVLTAVDGWVALKGSGVIDDDPEHGVLCEAIEGVSARVLIVTCPSTAQTYAHRVPAAIETAAAGRGWIMNLPDGVFPDVET